MLAIDLSSAATRIVSLATSDQDAADAATRVDSFSILGPQGPERAAALATFAGRDAAVVVWGAAGDHRQVIVRRGSYRAMRAEALKALAGAGVRTGGMLVDIVPVGPAAAARKRIVVASLADSAVVTNAVQPVKDAGIRVRSILTPGAALASMARLRHGHAHTSADAYVALGETATCIAIIRDGALVAARELGWGFHTTGVVPSWRREDIALRLADELQSFFGALGSSIGVVGQVCICGGLLDLRTMTMPLMERLDVEVETLDSLFGIDPGHLPEPADEFRDRCADLRIAWAAAADWPSPIDFLRARRRDRSRSLLSRAAMVAGVAIAPFVAWRLWPAAPASPPAPTRTSAAARSRPVPALEPTRAVAPPAPPIEPAPKRVVAPPSAPPAPPVEPAVPRITALRVASPPPPTAEPPRLAVTTASRPAAPRLEPSTPFDATLGMILFASDRRLAIIDGRIVGVGDDVHGARVVDIGASTVMLRDPLGRLRRLGTGATKP